MINRIRRYFRARRILRRLAKAYHWQACMILAKHYGIDANAYRLAYFAQVLNPDAPQPVGSPYDYID